jgi:uncharacterized protein (TIGR02271 family)
MAVRYTELHEGMDVYDTNNEKVGSIAEIYDAGTTGQSPSGGGYLRIPTGFLGLGKEHHVPFSAIRRVQENRVYLNVAKDQLDQLGYHQAPTPVDDQTSATTAADRTSADTAASTQAPRRVFLREEELVPRRRTVQTGEVDVHKEVVSEQRTLEVPVAHDEIVVERRSADRRPADQPVRETGEVIKIPVREEEVTLEKQPVVYEEVDIAKRPVQETQRVSETVRREELRVEDKGDVEVKEETTKPPQSPPP